MQLTSRRRADRTRPVRTPLLLVLAMVMAAVAACGDSNGGGGGTPATTANLADLTITSATVERVSASSCNGSTTCLIVTVANRGTVDASGLDDGCGTRSFGDPQPWSSFVLGGVVPAGATITYRSGYDNLEPHLPATFELFCEIDAVGRVDESNENNNTYTTTVSL